jgi:hypothetical protein
LLAADSSSERKTNVKTKKRGKPKNILTRTYAKLHIVLGAYSYAVEDGLQDAILTHLAETAGDNREPWCSVLHCAQPLNLQGVHASGNILNTWKCIS